MQSPVWLSYDPSYGTASVPSDWEYYSDDYWDEQSTTKGKRKGDAMKKTAARGDSTGHSAERKRRKLKLTEDVPEISLGESIVAAPTVVWKSKNDLLQPFEGPVVSEGQGERISLLKDWRERFKLPSKQNHAVSRPIEVQQMDSQKAVAVVVSTQSADRAHEDTLPPLGLPSRSKAFQSNTYWTSSATNRTTRATTLQAIPSQGDVEGQSVYGASSKSQKEKRPHPTGTPPIVGRTSSATFKKRKVASTGENTEATESQNLGESQGPARRTAALSTGKSGLEVLSGLAAGEAAPSRGKRKAEPEIELPVQSSKRKTSFRSPAADIADETWKDIGSPPSRRSNRKKRG